MISVREVVSDPDMIAPQPWFILRSDGTFVAGGYKTVVSSILMFGPVQQASLKEITMLPEADRIGNIRSFWSTVPIYTTNTTGASDILVYADVQHRVLQTYYEDGSGYWKALATQLRAA